VPSVHIDNAKAAYEAMDHLYRLGHRRIGVVIGPLVSPLSRDRLQGVKSCARKQKAEPTCVVMQGDFSIESGAVAAERLLGNDERPTAIFCFNDEMAMGVIQTAKRRGLRIPDDISVVGFDDIRFARCIDPPLTTMAQPMRAIGEGTVRLLLEILGGCSSPPESVTLPHTLIIRSSTAAPPHNCYFTTPRPRSQFASSFDHSDNAESLLPHAANPILENVHLSRYADFPQRRGS
jgi:LacI family repressor for deo operon, udp, cdd, tsx, nupC, and nupG